MTNSFETNFLSKAINNTPFTKPSTRNFFVEWCKINDSMAPIFVGRRLWNKREMLRINDQGKQVLILPNDLHLWEMIDVVRAIDHDTLTRNPKKKMKEQIK